MKRAVPFVQAASWLVLGVLLQSCAHHGAPVARTDPASPALAMEEFMVPSDPGIEVYVRNKYPLGQRNYAPGKVVLYVHGATYPSETSRMCHVVP